MNLSQNKSSFHQIGQYPNQQQQYRQQQQICALCNGPSMQPIVNHALYQKYSSSQNFFYTKQINQIIDQPQTGKYTVAVAQFKQYAIWDDQHQQMRRIYQSHQFLNKITMISEYYKFHRDVPMCYQKGVEKILGKYHSRIRQYDYKKIKKVLKEQQGISLTTQKTQSQVDQQNSSFIKKSRYSTMLNALHSQESRAQSQLLMDICDKIDKKISIKVTNKGLGFHLKGSFQNHHKDFQSFLQKQKIKKKRIQHPSFNKNKNHHQNVDLGLSKQINQGFKRPITHKNFLKKSIQKTTANDTISRQQKNKKIQKNQIKGPYISNKKLIFTNRPIQNQNKLFRPLTSNLLAMKSNSKAKTIDEIYKKTIPANTIQKYQSDKSRKSISTYGTSSKKIISRNLQYKSSNKKQKLTPYASKQIRSQFKTIQFDEKNQRINSRQQFLDKNFQKHHKKDEILVKKQPERKMMRSHSKNSLNKNAKSLQKPDNDNNRVSIIKRKSDLNLDFRKLRAFSSKQLDNKTKLSESQQKIKKRNSISRYQSTDLKFKNQKMNKAIQQKLVQQKMIKFKH